MSDARTDERHGPSLRSRILALTGVLGTAAPGVMAYALSSWPSGADKDGMGAERGEACEVGRPIPYWGEGMTPTKIARRLLLAASAEGHLTERTPPSR